MNPAVAVQRTVQATSALSRRRPPGRDWLSKTGPHQVPALPLRVPAG
jgi:hypothetical protein